MEPRSIHQLFQHTARARLDQPAYRYKRGGRWIDVTWGELRSTVDRIAKSLIALGVSAGDRVAILSQTRLEWVQCDLAAVSCGAVTVGVYPSDLAPECAYILRHSEALVVFVENAAQLEKVLAVRGELGALRRIVAFEAPADEAQGVLDWEGFLRLGREVGDAQLEQRGEALRPEDLASLVYTSGTTGVPKGAMITHGNVVFTTASVGRCLPFESRHVTLLFLPLAHVFARVMTYCCIRGATTVAFAESLASVPENLEEIRPHFLAGVPRFYEKFRERVLASAAAASPVRRRLFDWALGVGRRVSRMRQEGRPVPVGLALAHRAADRLVLRRVRQALGGRLEWAVSGAAPLGRDVAEFFDACGIELLEGIGMTENTSFSNVNRPGRNRIGTVGPVGPGIEMKIADDGEVLFRGENLMRGYFRAEEATAETIDADGWLHTGDMGEIDADGFLKITGRKKDLIITSAGKNVAPQRIERILCGSPYISQAVVQGDGRKYLVALVTLDADHVRRWAGSNGLADAGLEALAGDERVRRLIEKEIEACNRLLASFETVKKFRILPRDFSIESGELTPTLKIRRNVVADKHHDLIEEMYPPA